ncbi:methylated-DNA--protein-cysteine methyltransferase [Clostridia bacterium]|nr:methylated-DNA--protein-cysteine methyltransferase [Clostridia bacterium]
MKNIFYPYDTELGKIVIASDGTGITAVQTLSWFEEINKICEKSADKFTDEAARQLEQYFAGKRKVFELPLHMSGTSFQKSVWDALRGIPYGRTVTYKHIAKAVGNEKASRAVGGANHNNPVWIIVPCHRVVGSNGSLTGYAAGVEVKRYLLELERRFL